MEAALDVILEPTRALAPRVGAFSAVVRAGELVQAGQRLGELAVLNHSIALRVPAGSPALRVVAVPHETRHAPVGYRDVLLELEPAALGEGATAPLAGAAAESAALGLPPGSIAVRAPVDGQFYSRPSPQDPPFVAEGAPVVHGQVIGLVEVMKFFYEVPFDAPDPVARYEIVRLVATDGTALVSGEAIAWVVAV